MAKVELPPPEHHKTQCWKWVGRVTRDGKQYIYYDKRQVKSFTAGHPKFDGGSPARLLYKHFVNPNLPDERQLRRDRRTHGCQGHDCVNPWHFSEISIRYIHKYAEEFRELNAPTEVAVDQSTTIPDSISASDFAELCTDIDNRVAGQGRKPLEHYLEIFDGIYSAEEITAALKHLKLLEPESC
jgi:hypothetical protein